MSKRHTTTGRHTRTQRDTERHREPQRDRGRETETQRHRGTHRVTRTRTHTETAPDPLSVRHISHHTLCQSRTCRAHLRSQQRGTRTTRRALTEHPPLSQHTHVPSHDAIATHAPALAVATNLAPGSGTPSAPSNANWHTSSASSPPDAPPAGPDEKKKKNENVFCQNGFVGEGGLGTQAWGGGAAVYGGGAAAFGYMAAIYGHRAAIHGRRAAIYGCRAAIYGCRAAVNRGGMHARAGGSRPGAGGGARRRAVCCARGVGTHVGGMAPIASRNACKPASVEGAPVSVLHRHHRVGPTFGCSDSSWTWAFVHAGQQLLEHLLPPRQPRPCEPHAPPQYPQYSVPETPMISTSNAFSTGNADSRPPLPLLRLIAALLPW
eukprot:2701484-Rhodomonas_salina.3